MERSVLILPICVILNCRYYQPATADTWLTTQKQLVLSARQQDGGVFLCIAMRADSMGHSAKFGCYSTLDVCDNKVVVSFHFHSKSFILH